MAKKTTPKLDQPRNVTIVQNSIENFFMTDYYDYAKYTIADRALPSIVDGLKPGARKIMHAAFATLKSGKKEKFINLVGNTLSLSNYSHGDSSLLSTMMTLSASYNDNLAPLQIVGSGGDLRSPEAAAPRYLAIKLSKWAKLYQKDIHILEHSYEGDKKLEPLWYLPLIPTVLAARTTGMATGYKYDSQVSYNPANIVEQCISVLKTGNLSGKLRPHIEEWTGKYTQIDDRIWAEGSYRIEKDYIVVNEFAPNQTSESFESNIKKLLEDGKILKWENRKTEEKPIEYVIWVNSATLAKQVSNGSFKKTYLLGEFLKRPTYTLLDENSKIAIFRKPEEIISYFIDFRLGLYDKLKSVTIDDLEKRIAEANIIRKFIDLYLSDKIKIDKTVTSADLQKQLDSHQLPHWVADTRLSKLTKEEYDTLTDKIVKLEQELETIRTTATKDLYLRELEQLHIEMQAAFPLQDFEIREVAEIPVKKK